MNAVCASAAGSLQMVACLARRFQRQVVVAARGQRVPQIEEREPSGQCGHACPVGQQPTPDGGGAALAQQVAQRLQVRDHRRHQHGRRGRVIEHLVPVGELIEILGGLRRRLARNAKRRRWSQTRSPQSPRHQ